MTVSPGHAPSPRHVAVASCIPGASLIRYDDRTFEGEVLVKLGPIRARVKGSGEYQFDDQRHAIVVTGKGQDRITRSNVRGSLDLYLEESTPNTTHAIVTLSFDLQGTLAQFSRSSIIREFTAGLVNEFAERASATLSGVAPPPAKQNAVGFISLAKLGLQALWSTLCRRRR